MASPDCKAYIDELLDMSDGDLKSERSEIAEFFNGSNVLVTGGTGFLGKLLVEKLLRSCPGISTLYFMIRPKKGKTKEERFKENFNDVVYDRIRKEQPNYLSKVILLEGDTGEEGLSLSVEDKQLLFNTTVIFHCAATVRFNEKLRTAANINNRGVKQLLLFARSLPNLKAFVHVSTAFSHCVLKAIDEKHYKPPMDGDKLLTLMDILDDEKLDKLTPVLLDKWPNTYAYTKAIAENVVLQYSTGIPTCIVRPSIVISTSKEPFAGWTNNLYGVTGVTVGASLGILRTLHCVVEYIADIIPADYVISNIIAAAWSTATTRDISSSSIEADSGPDTSDSKRVPIFNSVSSCQKPISWGTYMKINEYYGLKIPTVKMIWTYSLWLNRYAFVNNICLVLFHLIPGIIFDTILYIIGRKPMLLNVYKKIHKFSDVIHYFSTRQWRFKNNNVLELWGKLNSTDREIFNFNIENLEWREYFYYYIRGLRLYIAKDPMETEGKARAKYFKLQIVNYTLFTAFSLLFLWGTVTFILYVWSFCPLAN